MKKHSPLFQKKPLLIFALGTVLLVSSLTLFAQTATGDSIITKMVATAHNFTLAGVLNDGDTSLQSSPLSGKKTGDMLTAGEYNRILELVGQGGGGGQSASNITILSTVDTLINTPGAGNGTISLAGKVPSCATHVILGSKLTQFVGDGTPRANDAEASMFINETLVGQVFLNSDWHHANTYDVSEGIFALGTNREITYRINAGGSYGSVSKYIFLKGYICGGGGGGGSGAGWEDVPLTGTADFDALCEYRFQGTGIAGQTALSTYYTNGVSSKALLWWVSSDGSQVHTISSTRKNQQLYNGAYVAAVTKIEKKCGGGGGGGGGTLETTVKTCNTGTPMTGGLGKGCTVTCDAGWKMISGGVHSGSNNYVQLSHPKENGWQVHIANNLGNPGAEGTGYVVCGKGVDGIGGGASGPSIIKGTASVGFFNAQPHSTMADVTFGKTCTNPVITVQSVNDSIACGNSSGQISCPSNPGTNSQDLHAYFGSVTATGFKVYLSAENGVWVGATSPAFKINYIVACD